MATTDSEESEKLGKPTFNQDEQEAAPRNEPASPAVPDNVTGRHSTSLLDEAVNYINDHLRAFRTIPWVVGGVGAILVIRYTSMFTRFRCPSDIPHQLLSQNKQLSGVVARTHCDSVDVWHVPYGRRLLRWKHLPPKACPTEELLKVRFAGVAIAQPSHSEAWLGTNLLGRKVWFTLLHCTAAEDSLYCVVYSRKRKGILRPRFCVNKELISRGLGSLDDAHGFQSSTDYVRFIQLLTKTEGVAQRRGIGVWEGSEYESRWRRLIRRMSPSRLKGL